MGIKLGGNDRGGGGFPDDGRLHLSKAERSLILHCYKIVSGPVLEDEEETGGMGGNDVVRAGRHIYGRGKGDGNGGGRGGIGRGGGVTEEKKRKKPGPGH